MNLLASISAATAISTILRKISTRCFMPTNQTLDFDQTIETEHKNSQVWHLTETNFWDFSNLAVDEGWRGR